MSAYNLDKLQPLLNAASKRDLTPNNRPPITTPPSAIISSNQVLPLTHPASRLEFPPPPSASIAAPPVISASNPFTFVPTHVPEPHSAFAQAAVAAQKAVAESRSRGEPKSFAEALQTARLEVSIRQNQQQQAIVKAKAEVQKQKQAAAAALAQSAQSILDRAGSVDSQAIAAAQRHRRDQAELELFELGDHANDAPMPLQPGAPARPLVPKKYTLEGILKEAQGSSLRAKLMGGSKGAAKKTASNRWTAKNMNETASALQRTKEREVEKLREQMLQRERAIQQERQKREGLLASNTGLKAATAATTAATKSAMASALAQQRLRAFTESGSPMDFSHLVPRANPSSATDTPSKHRNLTSAAASASQTVQPKFGSNSATSLAQKPSSSEAAAKKRKRVASSSSEDDSSDDDNAQRSTDQRERKLLRQLSSSSASTSGGVKPVTSNTNIASASAASMPLKKPLTSSTNTAAAAAAIPCMTQLPVIPLPATVASKCGITAMVRQQFVDSLLKLCVKAHPDRFDLTSLHPSLPSNTLVLRCEWEILEKMLGANEHRALDIQLSAYRNATRRVLQLMRDKNDIVAVAKTVSQTEADSFDNLGK